MQRLTRLAPMALGLLAGAASAQDDIDFDRYDTDHDGYLTQSEWNAVNNVTTSFDAIDTNRDGRLSKGEVDAGITAEERNVSQQNIDWQTGGQGGGQAGKQESVTAPVSEVDSQPRNVQMYDTDNDNRVSREEAQKDGELVTYFVIWDTNQDGFLDENEMDEGGRKTKDARRNVEQGNGDTGAASFQQADANRDNRVSRTEANDANAEYIVIYFDTLDANQDGYVDRSEVGAGQDQPAGNGANMNNGDDRFERYDANGDGFLTEAEWSEMPVSMEFRDADVNRDGQVDEAELLQGYPWQVNEFEDKRPYNDPDPEY
ncbi:MAG TPA: hypothetical protein VF254_06915 [Gammaproteobacteria bacterium]